MRIFLFYLVSELDLPMSVQLEGQISPEKLGTSIHISDLENEAERLDTACATLLPAIAALAPALTTWTPSRPKNPCPSAFTKRADAMINTSKQLVGRRTARLYTATRATDAVLPSRLNPRPRAS